MNYQCLPNGFQVIYENPVSSTPLTSLYVICKIGSIHEPRHLKGISHLIEHMSFKGTKRIPNTQKFLEQFDILGIEQNAYTFAESVWFYIKCPDEQLKKCLELLAESILLCDFNAKNFIKEEEVVNQENRMDDDKPEYVASKATNELVYEDTHFQWPVDDSIYHKTKFNYKDVLDYYKKTYIQSNLFLTISTNVKFNTVMNYIKKTEFSKKSDSSANQLTMIPQRSGFDYKIIHSKNFKTTILNISLKTCDYYSNDSYILGLISIILCNGINSRLVNTLRQKHGLVYYVNGTTEYNFCGGKFTISTQCNASSLMEENGVLPLIIKELKRFRKGITQKELTISKMKKKEGLLFELDDRNTLSNYNGWSLLYYPPSKIVPYSKIYETFIEKITVANVNACIKKYFCLERMCLVVVGNNLPPTEIMVEECLRL